MDFALTAEQQALAEVVRDLGRRLNPPERLRSLWDGADPDPGVWRALADIGVLGALVPAAHGGLGGTLLDVVAVCEEVGRAALPEPVIEATVVALPLAAAAGEDTSAVLAGQAVATAAVDSPYAPWAADAGLVVGVEADHAFLAGSATRLVGEDPSRRLAQVERSAVRLLDVPAEQVRRARDRYRVGIAAALVGLSRHLLEVSCQHATVRRQFGVPIGSFQAVAHQLADVAVGVEAAGALVRIAAYADAGGEGGWGVPERRRAAASAAAYTAEVAARANRVALQVHGGIGFTWEHDLHLWLKRGLAWQQTVGGAGAARAWLAVHLLDGEVQDG